MFGALSLLGIATGVANLGFVLFILSSIISMFTTYFTILFLAETASFCGRMTTCSLAEHYLGEAGKFVTQFFITVGNWFYMVYAYTYTLSYPIPHEYHSDVISYPSIYALGERDADFRRFHSVVYQGLDRCGLR